MRKAPSGWWSSSWVEDTLPECSALATGKFYRVSALTPLVASPVRRRQASACAPLRAVGRPPGLAASRGPVPPDEGVRRRVVGECRLVLREDLAREARGEHLPELDAP